MDLSAKDPVLFVLEDAHWIDATTLEMIELCLDGMSHTNIMMLVTARPTFEHRFSGHPIVTQLTLNRLSREQISEIVFSLAGGKSLPEELLEEIAQKTDGVPLFVEELTKTVLESPELTETEHGFELNGPLSRLAIPATLHDSLMARLDRLQPVKEVAQMAACIGREFEYHLLSDVSPLEQAALQAALDRLVSAELIFHRGLASDGSYIFKHALVRDAAYESLLKTRRRAIHGKLLDALESRDDAAPEVLAHHATQAGETEKAIDYWQLAGEQARLGSAVLEAIAHFTQALDLLLAKDPSLQRDERELELQKLIGSASIAAYGYGASATIAAFDRGLELTEHVDRPDLLFPILYGQYVYRYIQGGGTNAAHTNAKRLLDRANQQSDSVPKMIGHRCTGMTLFCQGQFAASQEHFKQAIDLYRPQTGHALIFEYGTDSKVSAQVFLSTIMLLRGFPDQAKEMCAEAFEVARQAKNIHTLEYGLFFGPIRNSFCRRDLSEFEQCIAELAAVAEEHKLPMWQAYAATQQGWFHSQQGRHDAALALLRNGLDRMQVNGTTYDRPMAAGQLVEACLRAGRHEDGLDAVEQAVAAVQSTNERWFEPEIYRLKGELLAGAGNGLADEAATAFETSLELARNLDARWWELRTATSWVTTATAEPHRSKALQTLQRVYQSFTEGFGCDDVINAKNVLASASS